VDAVVRERIAGADGHARRQSGIHIYAVRDRNGGRSAHHQGGRFASAAWHDVGRHRSSKFRSIQRHWLVFPFGVHYEVSRLSFNDKRRVNCMNRILNFQRDTVLHRTPKNNN